MGKKNKWKYVNKHGSSQFIMYSVKGQQLNDREVYTINNHATEGMVQFGVVRKRSGFELIYNLNGLIPLEDFLINPLNRESFARILQNILDVLKGMETVYFHQKCLLMDFERVMINPATQKLQFIYVPIQDFDGGCELKHFLLDIIQKSIFVKEEDSNYIREYIRILNDGINFSVFELEEYIKALVSEKGYRLENTVTCFKCGTQVNKGINFCPVCGAKIGMNTEEIGNAIYNPLKTMEKENGKTDSPKEHEARKERSWSEHGTGTQGLSSKEEEPEEIETTLLGMYKSMYEEEGYLIREKTGEKIVISKASFRLGKSAANCDYAVPDNKMVSRIHADIIKEQQRYFIVDLGSTNKTYVENRMVSEREELQSGNRVRLANEAFTFYTEG